MWERRGREGEDEGMWREGEDEGDVGEGVEMKETWERG